MLSCIPVSIIKVHAFLFRVASIPEVRYDLSWRLPIVHYVSGIYGYLYIHEPYVNLRFMKFVWVWVIMYYRIFRKHQHMGWYLGYSNIIRNNIKYNTGRLCVMLAYYIYKYVQENKIAKYPGFLFVCFSCYLIYNSFRAKEIHYELSISFDAIIREVRFCSLV